MHFSSLVSTFIVLSISREHAADDGNDGEERREREDVRAEDGDVAVAELPRAHARRAVGRVGVAHAEGLAARVELHAVADDGAVGLVHLGAAPLLHLADRAARLPRVGDRVGLVPLQAVLHDHVVPYADEAPV